MDNKPKIPEKSINAPLRGEMAKPDITRLWVTGSNKGLMPMSETRKELEPIQEPERAYRGYLQNTPEIPLRITASDQEVSPPNPPNQEKLDKWREAGLFTGFGSHEESEFQNIPEELRHPVKQFREKQRFLNKYAKRQEEYFKGHYLEDIRKRSQKLEESIGRILKNPVSSSSISSVISTMIFGSHIDAYNEDFKIIKEQLSEFEKRIEGFKRYIQDHPKPSIPGSSNSK